MRRHDGLRVIVDAVQQECDSRAGLPADADAHLRSVRCCGGGRNGAGGKRGKLKIVAAVERQVGDLLIADDRADGGVGSLEQRRRRFDVHAIGNLAHFKHRVHLANIADVEHDAALVETLESRGLDADRVFADPQWRRAVFASIAGVDLNLGVRGQMRQRDRQRPRRRRSLDQKPNRPPPRFLPVGQTSRARKEQARRANLDTIHPS